MFDAYKSQMKPETSETTEIIRHCLLISNSHPCPDLVHRNLDEKYDQYSMKKIVEEMKNVCNMRLPILIEFEIKSNVSNVCFLI